LAFTPTSSSLRVAIVTGATRRLGRVAAQRLARDGTPDDIAEGVSFLVGPAGRWINGQVPYADGRLR
jgi:NAD(P)-dependent dehydrogenase (short-subunit alcohol dehydrogenase family)